MHTSGWLGSHPGFRSPPGVPVAAHSPRARSLACLWASRRRSAYRTLGGTVRSMAHPDRSIRSFTRVPSVSHR